MLYKKLGKTNIDASVIGLGGEWLNGVSEEDTTKIIDSAIANGVNYIDIFMPQAKTRSNIGVALQGKRDKMFIQGHLCTVFEDGQYERTRDIEKTKTSFEDLLSRLQTDYIDVGMIHYIDSFEDYDIVFNGDIFKYAKELKTAGVIHHIGMSSHNPLVALKAVESGNIDVLMFSINPAYDFEKSNTDIMDLMEYKDLNENAWSIDDSRQKLYTTCEQMGVGITVMKALGAGSLLKAESSPFKKALTVQQCCHYCLTRSGVSSVLIGCHTIEEILHAVSYCNMTDSEKDFSHIFSGDHKIEMTGKCMYCNHCQPCPSHIDIAAVTKFYHLATMQSTVPDTVRQHYFSLEKTAKDCIMCGKCEPNCPFGVNVRENMQK